MTKCFAYVETKNHLGNKVIFWCSGGRDRTYDQPLTFSPLLLVVRTISSPYFDYSKRRSEALRILKILLFRTLLSCEIVSTPSTINLKNLLKLGSGLPTVNKSSS